MRVSRVEVAGGDWLLYLGARTSRSSKSVEDMIKEATPRRMEFLFRKLLGWGHLSVFEHSLIRVWVEDDPEKVKSRLFHWKFVELSEDEGLLSMNPRVAIEMMERGDPEVRELAKRVLLHFPILSRAVGLSSMGEGPEAGLRVELSSDEVEDVWVHMLLASPWPDPRHGFHAFLVEGISRVCSHQLVRHRALSFTQQSQRVSQVVGYYLPGHLDAELRKRMEREVERSLKTYYGLVDAGVEMEDARYILPQACTTRILISGRDSAWIHFIRLRAAPEAQREIRLVAQMVQSLSGLEPGR